MNIGKALKALVRISGPVGTVLGVAATVFTGISQFGELKEVLQKANKK